MKSRSPHTTFRSRLPAVALLVALPALAAPLAARAGEREQNELHRQVERGEVQALSEILAVVRRRVPGDVVKVEVERHDGRWLYEIRVVDAKGRVFEIYVNAADATIERIKEK